MRKIEQKQYHGPAKALKEKHLGRRLKKRILLILPLLTLLAGVTIMSFTFSPNASVEVEENNSAIIETATRLRDSGIDSETAAVVLKESFKGYYVQSSGEEVTIGLYKKNGNIVQLVKIIFNK